MKQEEKNELSKTKIINSAIEEFSNHNYDKSSVNNICKENDIPKGLIYHYFKNKDELYMSCLKICFDSLTDFLKTQAFCAESFSIKAYVEIRNIFFKNNRSYSNIFFNAILKPPTHLINDINVLKKELNMLNLSFFKSLVEKIQLAPDISKDEAIEYFLDFQDMFNAYYQIYNSDENFDTLIEKHEIKLIKIFNILIRGITRD